MPQFPSGSSSSGLWSLKKQKRAQQGFNWPFSSVPLAWTTNYGNTTTISSSTVVTANTGTNSNGYGYFSGALPAQSCYLDLTMDSGLSSSPFTVNFVGVANEVSQFGYTAYSKYKAWYYNAQWYGDGTNYVNPPTSQNAGTYRIAVNREIRRLYIRGPSSAVVASADLPTGSNLYLVVLPQNGYATSGATIVNGAVYGGSGGLY